MNRYVWLLVVFVTVGCVNKVSERQRDSEVQPDGELWRSLDLKPLVVEKIRFDSQDFIEVKQIVFEFNQNVSILGGIPSQAQIDAISFSNDLNSTCIWRFIQLDKLACELQNRLSYLTSYNISIDTSFTALGKTLATGKSVSLTTSLPPVIFAHHGSYSEFPESINIETYHPMDISVSAFNRGLKLKLPNNQYRDARVTQVEDKYQRVQWQVEVIDIDKSLQAGSSLDELPEGKYQWVFPKGFQASDSQVTLQEETVLDDFWYSPTFRFYGFACKSAIFFNQYVDIEFELEIEIDNELETALNAALNSAPDFTRDTEQTLPCPPEHIALSFSKPPAETIIDEPIQAVNWLTGPKYLVKGTQQRDRRFYQTLMLSGESGYQLDLAKISSISGDTLSESKIITFRTRPASPYWGFDAAQGTVVESDSEVLPYIVRRNVSDLQQDFSVLHTANDLLTFLNGDLQHNETSLPDVTSSSRQFWQQQNLDFRDYLQSKSGLVHMQLSGKSVDSGFNFEAAMHDETFMLQSADYNVALWHGSDLLVQALDWQAKPISMVEVILVCDTMKFPMELGKTNSDGLLWLKSEEWRSSYHDFNEAECWVWTQKNNQLAALELPESKAISEDEVNIFARSAQPIYQPGDTVNLGAIARRRTELGLMPVNDYSSYQLVVKDFNGEVLHALELADLKTTDLKTTDLKTTDLKTTDLETSDLEKTVSKHAVHRQSPEQGFFSAQLQLSEASQTGEYRIRFKHKKTGFEHYAGSFVVAEFTPPEFEYSLELPELAQGGQSLNGKLSARRMNRRGLKNAKAEFNISIERNWNEPDSWPEEYEFNSWDDFDKNKNGHESIAPVSASLDEQGEYEFHTEPLLSSVPYGKVLIVSNVVADDGETQHRRSEIRYISREHFIGTRFNSDLKQLDVIAIDFAGKPLTDIRVSVSANINANTRGKDGENSKLIEQCQLETLPGSCVIDSELTHVDLEISSGHQNYKWYRQYRYAKEESKPLDLRTAFELSGPSSPISSGENISIELRSAIAGTATFILQAGEVQKVWREGIVKGINNIQLQVEAGWVPYARIFASLPRSRQAIRDEIGEKIKTRVNAEAQKNTGKQISAKTVLRELRQVKRLLTSDVLLNVHPDSATPSVKLSVADSSVADGSPQDNSLQEYKVKAGSTANVTIESDMAVQSQVWLVNEALLNLMDVQEKDFDYQQKLTSTYAFERALNFDVLSEYLNTESLMERSEILEKISVTESMMMRESAGMAYGDAHISDSSQRHMSDFAHSVWLDRINLKPGQPKAIKIKLPQLIGRWKVLALSAANQTMSIDSAAITTTRDIEYFFDAPTTIVKGDKAEFAITQISDSNAEKGNTVIEDEVTVWLNNEKVLTVPIALEGDGYQRAGLPMPILSPGLHTIKMTSQRQPDFATFHQINVLDDKTEINKSWLISGTEHNQMREVQLPFGGQPEDLQLRVMAAEQQVPDWQALAHYHRDYPHQCWEQTLSRAVSYQFNPIAKSQWQQGQQTFSWLLNKQHKHRNYGGFYSYFPGLKSDGFLTAWTYLVSAWLQDSNTPIDIDANEAKELMLQLISGESYSPDYLMDSSGSGSMALLALAVNGDIELQEALAVRQSLGNRDLQSSLLQALALKELGASPDLYQSTLDNLNESQYLDDNTSVFNQSVDKCLAIMVYEQDVLEVTVSQRAALIAEVVREQQQLGHFGSTFANAICAHALKDLQGSGAKSTPIDFTQSLDKLRFQINGKQINNKQISNNQKANEGNYWLQLSYKQLLQDIAPLSSGISIKRSLWVKRDGSWQKLVDGDILQVGEIVKTQLNVDSPKQRQHIAISAPIAGGFEAVNPSYNNQFYQELHQNNWFDNHRLEIRNGLVRWYLHYLDKGQLEFSYYSRVRHQGEYIIPPANIEAMYRKDVHANTGTMVVTNAD